MNVTPVLLVAALIVIIFLTHRYLQGYPDPKYYQT